MAKYISTGFPALDEYTKGLKNGELIVVGGRPAMGKTAFMLNITKNLIINQKRVLYISLDKEADDIFKRLAVITPSEDFARLVIERSYVEILDYSMQIISLELLNRMIYRAIKNIERKYKCITSDAVDLIVIDGIDNIFFTNTRLLDKNIIHDVLVSLKDHALHYNCPVVITAGIKRNAEKRQNRRPLIDDFNTINGKDDYIDEVIMLYRENYYNNSSSENDNTMELIIEKHSDKKPKTLLCKIAEI